MKQKNFARFYALLKTVQGNKEDLKITLVRQFTGNRTESLREMTTEEYTAMCDSIDPKSNDDMRSQMKLKSERSSVLRRIQKLGVDTSDWNKVDEFTLHPRIAGKRFSHLSIDELRALTRKLIAIAKKSPRKPTPKREVEIDEDEMYQLLAVSSIPRYVS
ncbi:MAG: hypothetical protein SNF92_08210 [Rikenellaceae bacterium]